MPDQVVPITGVDSVGLIQDTPAVSLPPNAFSDALNVRFRDGAVRKMEGEVNIFPGYFDSNQPEGMQRSYDDSDLKYVAWWPNPNIQQENTGYYLIVRSMNRPAEEGLPAGRRDIVELVKPTPYTVGNVRPLTGNDPLGPGTRIDLPVPFYNGGTQYNPEDIFEEVYVPPRPEIWQFWDELEAGQPLHRRVIGYFRSDAPAGSYQHTLFQGGFSVILNNGMETPLAITDIEGNDQFHLVPQMVQLPGWSNYQIDEVVVNQTITALSGNVFNLGSAYPFQEQTEVNGVPTTVNVWNIQVIRTRDGSSTAFTLTQDENTNTNVMALGDNNTSITFVDSFLVEGDQLVIRAQSVDNVEVTAGVLRSFGDFLVAGNLNELHPITNEVLRNLGSVVRSSDAAAPGNIPQNWNPYVVGVSTADEFLITADSVVQDMVELQGNLYMYSSSSISALRRTGNVQVPLQSQPVTDSYGALTTNSVIEFDGQHFVVGSQDIYLFGGHPGSIQSVADGKVRRSFYENLSPIYQDRMFVIRYQQRDEIWICYPSIDSNGTCDRALIWGYRNNTWTQRELRNVISGEVAPVPGGGVPEARITLSGSSGDNGVVDTGAQEIQTISLQPNTHVREVPTGGKPAEGYIHVLDIPAVNITAPEIFDFALGPDPVTFDSGPRYSDTYDSENPNLMWEFSLVGSDTSFTFNIPTHLRDDELWDPAGLYTMGHRVRYNGVYYLFNRPANRELFYEGQRSRAIYNGGGIYDVQEDPYVALTPDDEDSDWIRDTDQTVHDHAWIIQELHDYFEMEVAAQNHPIFVGDVHNDQVNGVEDFFIRFEEPLPSHTGVMRMIVRGDNGSIGDVVEDNRPGDPSVPGGFAPILNLIVHDMVYDGFQLLENHVDPPNIISVTLHGQFQQNDADRRLATLIRDAIQNAMLISPRVPRFNARLTTRETLGFYDGGIVYGRPNGHMYVGGEVIHPTYYLESEILPDTPTTYTNSVFFQGSDNRQQSLRLTRGRIGLGAEFMYPGTAADGPMTQASMRDVYGGPGHPQLFDDDLFYQVNDVEPSAVLPGQDANGNDYGIGPQHFRDCLLDAGNQGRDVIEWPQFTAFDPDTGREFTQVTYNANVHGDTPEELWDFLLNYMSTNFDYMWTGENFVFDYSQTETPISFTFGSFGVLDENVDADDPSRDPRERRRRIVDNPIRLRLDRVGNSGVVHMPSSSIPFDPRFGEHSAQINGQAECSFPFRFNNSRSAPIATRDNTDYRGDYLQRAIPSFLAIEIRNPERPGALELMILEAGDKGSYDVNNHDADDINGQIYLAADTLSANDPRNSTGEELPSVRDLWASAIQSFNENLIVELEGRDTIVIRPGRFSGNANFVLGIYDNFGDTTDINNTIERFRRNGHDIIGYDPYYRVRSNHTFESFIRRDSNSPEATGPRSPQSNLSPQTPNDTLVEFQGRATLVNNGGRPGQVWDLDRPWATEEVNFGQEYPIFATSGSTTIVNPTNDELRSFISLPKIIAADVGYSFPESNQSRRKTYVDNAKIFYDFVEGDDFSTAYSSYVERKQLGITPEFDTENLASAALWATGVTSPYVISHPIYNRLDIRMEGTNAPEVGVDLSSRQSMDMARQSFAANDFDISEDYKVDMRVHGRFINYRITDDIADPSVPRFLDLTEPEGDKVFNRRAEWQVSGLQVDIQKGGRR